MHPDEPTAPAGRALSPEEVGARVSEILEAAERDARAVIEEARREAAPPEQRPAAIEDLARELEALTGRVGALERALVTVESRDQPHAEDTPAPGERRERRAAVIDAAARVRAIELALAGYSRDAIAKELTASMPAAEIEGLLDEVLAR